MCYFPAEEFVNEFEHVCLMYYEYRKLFKYNGLCDVLRIIGTQIFYDYHDKKGFFNCCYLFWYDLNGDDCLWQLLDCNW